jgi:RNA polymerase primary sigma factor
MAASSAARDTNAMAAPVTDPDGQLIVGIAIRAHAGGRRKCKSRLQRPRSDPVQAGRRTCRRRRAGSRREIGDSSLDDDDMDNWLSVAAIEAELKPNVIEIFDTIAGTYKRLRRLQGQDIQFQLTRLSLSPAQKRKHKKLKNEIIGEVKSLRLKQAHIDAPVEQLYDINKRLVALLRPKRSTLSGGIGERIVGRVHHERARIDHEGPRR